MGEPHHSNVQAEWIAASLRCKGPVRVVLAVAGPCRREGSPVGVVGAAKRARVSVAGR